MLAKFVLLVCDACCTAVVIKGKSVVNQTKNNFLIPVCLPVWETAGESRGLLDKSG